MLHSQTTRRHLLRSIGTLTIGSAGLAALAACGAAATPTAVPAKPAEKPAAQAPAPAPANAVATKPAADAAPKAAQPATNTGAKIPLSVAVWEFPDRPWQTPASQKWQEMHPEVDLKIEKMVYGEFDKKQLALMATGSLQDVFYSGIKWFPTTALKGGMLALDDLVKSKEIGIDDFVPAALQGAKFEGKLMALPFETQPGNHNAVMFNKDYLDSKGVKYPTDDWTYEQYTEMSVKLTDKDKRIWGTDGMIFDNYYDFTTIAYAYGGSLLSDDAKKFQLTDPKTMEAARWQYDLLNKHKAAPLRGDKEGLSFPSGRIGLSAVGVQSVRGLGKTIADKFKWDVVLGPVGPTGIRGSDGFVSMYSISAKTKSPEKAFDLLAHLTSKDVSMKAFVEEGQPPSRKSIWTSDEAVKVNPIWGRAIKFMSDPKTKGPFPHPANLRFAELQDKWVNTSYPAFYGEVPFEEGMKKTQEACQAIMDLPRP